MTDDIFSLPKERDRVVGLPVESTANLSFGGANLDVAYVTWITRMVKGGGPESVGQAPPRRPGAWRTQSAGAVLR